ncbi:MAG TPA: YggT family protein [Azospirillaceae bacterium]|nr:YggT family protein [Azospirillaceae bacterium]
MGPILQTIFELLFVVLDIYKWILIISAVMSWLIAFNVINTRNQFVYTVSDMLYRLTEPVLRPIRRVVPSMGGLDISPIIALLLIFALQRLIINFQFI